MHRYWNGIFNDYFQLVETISSY